jgi:VacB/RNase II family 3'-5' exoribonuclease
MLLANREVAIFVNKKYKKEEKGTPLFLYRIHDTPDKDRIAELSIFLKAIGYSLPIEDGSVTGNDLNALFKKIEGEAEEGLIKTTTIRSMAKAIYSTNNIGHFGLSFDYYTHFTSPIRRYPDVLVHRLLQKHLLGEKIPQQEFAFYENMASQNTESEIKAAEAERESIKLKQVEYMSNKINQPLSGIISGITDWGVYIEEKETKAEGLLKLRDLNDDYYKVDAKNYCIVGEKTGKRIRLGDNVKFKFSAFDIEKKTLDCKLIAN